MPDFRYNRGLEAGRETALVSSFGPHLAKSARIPPKLGDYLNNLKDDWESGNYDVYSGIDREAADNALWEAEEFVVEAERYLGCSTLKTLFLCHHMAPRLFSQR